MWRGEGLYENSVLSSQFLYECKTALKINCINYLKIQTKEMYSDHCKSKVSHYFSEKCRSLDLPFSNVWISEIFLSCVQLKAYQCGLPQAKGQLDSKINCSP